MCISSINTPSSKNLLKLLIRNFRMEIPPNKFVWAHADYESNREMILEVVKKGYWVGFDTIREGTYEVRKQIIDHSVAHHYSHQVILSQDYDLI